jgi:hypothetical protein
VKNQKKNYSQEMPQSINFELDFSYQKLIFETMSPKANFQKGNKPLASKKHPNQKLFLLEYKLKLNENLESTLTLKIGFRM